MIVISNGMLRSGSTLQYNVAASVLETAGQVTRGGFIGEFAKPEIRAKLDALKTADGWTIVKTHEAPLERSFYDDRVRVLFSYRDVRDIAASIKKKWGYPFEQILADIDAMIEIERAFADIPNVLVQSYDTLYTDLPAATREIAEFLGVRVGDADVAHIADEFSVESSKQRLEARAKHPLVQVLGRIAGRFRIDPTTQMHDNHISATGGQDGDWLNQFEATEIAALNERFGDWLIGHGYAPMLKPGS